MMYNIFSEGCLCFEAIENTCALEQCSFRVKVSCLWALTCLKYKRHRVSHETLDYFILNYLKSIRNVSMQFPREEYLFILTLIC